MFVEVFDIMDHLFLFILYFFFIMIILLDLMLEPFPFLIYDRLLHQDIELLKSVHLLLVRIVQLFLLNEFLHIFDLPKLVLLYIIQIILTLNTFNTIYSSLLSFILNY